MSAAGDRKSWIMPWSVFYFEKRAKGKLAIECIMYANDFGALAKSKEAEEWFTLLAQEAEQQI